MVSAQTMQPDLEQVWSWLAAVPDPEIPVISVVDLGIVRAVSLDGETLVVTVTPTYSGCPATEVIARDIERALKAHGVEDLRLETRISPPWSTDRISARGRRQLRSYGIAPPSAGAHEVRIDAASLFRKAAAVECPRCGSNNTQRVSEFGSTPCKAHYKCRDCLEPFDYFKRL
jgi:ring-1,2-phenylacetyl-CoA epoxidase subunit PaaD